MNVPRLGSVHIPRGATDNMQTDRRWLYSYCNPRAIEKRFPHFPSNVEKIRLRVQIFCCEYNFYIREGKYLRLGKNSAYRNSNILLYCNEFVIQCTSKITDAYYIETNKLYTVRLIASLLWASTAATLQYSTGVDMPRGIMFYIYTSSSM